MSIHAVVIRERVMLRKNSQLNSLASSMVEYVINAVVIRERVMPRKNSRLDGLAGSMVWPARWWNTLVVKSVPILYYSSTGKG
jgi:hypothetical protein